MLEDYSKYLFGIRNNLIQCGVELPITSSMSYGQLFELGDNLDSLLWYYSVLCVSGSVDGISGFFLPLNNTFIGRMRKLYFLEFQDFLKEYNKISVKGYLLKDKYKKNILDKPSNNIENSVKLSEMELEYSLHGLFVENYALKENVKEVVNKEDNLVMHGKFVEDFVTVEIRKDIIETDVSEVDMQFVYNGRFVEDFENADESDYLIEKGIENTDLFNEDDLIETTDESESDLIIESEFSDYLLEEDLIDENDLVDENDLIEEDDLLEEDLIEEDDLLEDDLINENDLIKEDDLLEDDLINENDLIEEDDLLEDDLIEEEDLIGNDLIEEDLLEEDLLEDDLIHEKEDTGKIVSEELINNSPSRKRDVKSKVPEKDLSDYLQDFTNGLLTSGKRAIIKGIRKLES